MNFLRPGKSRNDRVVPPSGASATLTTFTAAAMTFLAVFATALSRASDRLAPSWADALDRTATVRISAPDDQLATQTKAVIDLLKTTPGIASARSFPVEEAEKLLEQCFGPNLPLDDLPLPQLVEVKETDVGYDAAGLRQRLAAEAPGAVLDDHLRWRRPMAEAAGHLRLLGIQSIALIGAAMAAMITLAANAALASNARIIRVLRLVGARDNYIAKALVRRFTLSAASGALAGVILGMIGISLLPAQDAAGSFLTGLGFIGLAWLYPLGPISLAAIVAFIASRTAAFRTLKGLT